MAYTTCISTYEKNRNPHIAAAYAYAEERVKPDLTPTVKNGVEYENRSVKNKLAFDAIYLKRMDYLVAEAKKNG